MVNGLCEALLLIFVFHPGLVKGPKRYGIPRNGNNTGMHNTFVCIEFLICIDLFTKIGLFPDDIF